MIPSLGRIVLVRVKDAVGRPVVAPAIITNVHNATDTRDSPACISMTAFPDQATPKLLSSIQLYDTEEDGDWRNPEGAQFAYWPPRV